MRVDGVHFARRTSLQLFCQVGGSRNRGRAAATQESRFRDVPGFHANCQAENVATNRIAHFDGMRGVRQFAGVAWPAKMIENRRRKHLLEISYNGFSLICSSP